MVKSCRVKSIHLVHWNCTTSKCGKKKRTWLAPVPQAPILFRPGAKRHPTGGKRSDLWGLNDRKPAIFPGQKIWRLDPQRWEARNSAEMEVCFTKIGICHMCQKIVKHQVVWNGASPIAWGYHSVWYGPTIVGEELGDVSGYQPSKIRWKLTRFEPPKAQKYGSQ